VHQQLISVEFPEDRKWRRKFSNAIGAVNKEGSRMTESLHPAIERVLSDDAPRSNQQGQRFPSSHFVRFSRRLPYQVSPP
jgi:hypothetical protein